MIPTTKVIPAAAAVAASLAFGATPSIAAPNGACIPVGATALKKAPAGEASVYAAGDGVLSACLDDKTSPIAVGGWSNVKWQTSKLEAASGTCVAISTITEDDFTSGASAWSVYDVKARTRWKLNLGTSGNQYIAYSISDFTFGPGCSAAWVSTESGNMAVNYPNGTSTVVRNDSRGREVVTTSLEQAIADLQGVPESVAHGDGPKLAKTPALRRSNDGRRLVLTFSYPGKVGKLDVRVGGRKAKVSSQKLATAPRGTAKRGSKVAASVRACDATGCRTQNYKLLVR